MSDEKEFEMSFDDEMVGDDEKETLNTDENDSSSDDSASVGESEEASLTNDSEWAKDLSEDLKKAPSLQKFKNVDAMAKAYVELEKSQGKSPFPGPKSTEEERIAFYRKAGIPEPEKFELDGKKYGLNDEVSKELKEIASKKGVSPHALDSVLNYINEKNSLQTQAQAEKSKAITKEQLDGLKREYGTAFDKYLKLGSSVAQELYSKEELNALKESGMSKNPLFVKALMDRARSKYGEELIEDDHTSKNFAATPQAIENRIGEIMQDKDYHDASSPRHNSLVQEMEKLFKVKSKSS